MSARLRGQPPGRAGLSWLGRRSAVAERAVELLERKLRILLAEEQAYAMRAERTQRDWSQAEADLQRLMLRSGLLGGQRAIRLVGDGADCQIDISWALTMGVRYPSSVECRVPPRTPGARLAGNSALLAAGPAAERAVRAGVEHAVAIAALDAIRAEVASTRQQMRALRDRWIPRLEEARSRLLVGVDDLEQEEHVRLRWAAREHRQVRGAP